VGVGVSGGCREKIKNENSLGLTVQSTSKSLADRRYALEQPTRRVPGIRGPSSRTTPLHGGAPVVSFLRHNALEDLQRQLRERALIGTERISMLCLLAGTWSCWNRRNWYLERPPPGKQILPQFLLRHWQLFSLCVHAFGSRSFLHRRSGSHSLHVRTVWVDWVCLSTKWHKVNF